MKTRLCALALGAASLFGVGSHEAQADYGCYSYYYTYTRSPSVVVYPVVYQAPVIYHYHYPSAPVLMVAPAQMAPTLRVAPSATAKIAPGSAVRVKGKFLGSEAGSVFVMIGSVSMECQVQEWNPEYVQVQLPKMGVTANSSAQILVADKQGTLKRRAHFVLVPTPDTEVVPQGEAVARGPIELAGNL